MYFIDFQNFVKTSLTNLRFEIKSMAYSIETLKNLTAQIVENWALNINSEMNYTSCEIIWPVNNSDELKTIETLLNDQKIKNNQVWFLEFTFNLLIQYNISVLVYKIIIFFYNVY